MSDQKLGRIELNDPTYRQLPEQDEEIGHLRELLRKTQAESDRRGRLIESMRLRIEELQKIMASVLESIK